MEHIAAIARALSASRTLLAGVILAMISFSACVSHPQGRVVDAPDEFWSALESLCGKAYEGRVVEDTTNDPRFARSPLIMHVAKCDDGRILVPFHIADDRSRTWVFTRTPAGLRLKHDHRHQDGTEDDLTQYGGDTRDSGTSTSQRFHADEHTASLIPAASTNIWTVEVVPGRAFVYMLEREGTDRRFRVEFDLTRRVAIPPPAWGW
jgi:hypothetical protein